jgi:small-conductance mechanosensitive channel
VKTQFGNSSLDFELIAFIMDIDNAANTRSDLHFAIFKAFKDAGIEIPLPQRDLHIKPDQGRAEICNSGDSNNFEE